MCLLAVMVVALFIYDSCIMFCPICGLEQEREVRVPDLLPPSYPRCPGCGRRHPIYDIDKWLYDRLQAYRREVDLNRRLIIQTFMRVRNKYYHNRVAIINPYRLYL